MSLCHEVDTRAAFARARFAYSLARSLTKFRPVVRTGSISMRRGAWLAESTFMPLVSAVVPRRSRSVLVVLCALSNAIMVNGSTDEEETLRGLLGAASAQDRQAA